MRLVLVVSELLAAKMRRRLGLCPYNVILGRDMVLVVSSVYIIPMKSGFDIKSQISALLNLGMIHLL